MSRRPTVLLTREDDGVVGPRLVLLHALAAAAEQNPPPPEIADRAAVLVHGATRTVTWIDRFAFARDVRRWVPRVSSRLDAGPSRGGVLVVIVPADAAQRARVVELGRAS